MAQESWMPFHLLSNSYPYILYICCALSALRGIYGVNTHIYPKWVHVVLRTLRVRKRSELRREWNKLFLVPSWPSSQAHSCSCERFKGMRNAFNLLGIRFSVSRNRCLKLSSENKNLGWKLDPLEGERN